MKAEAIDGTQRATARGGWALIAATLLFSAVFVYLAQAFDYPAVLDRPAEQVLPRLLALGGTGRAVWVLYGLIPWLLLPAGLGVLAAGRQAAPRAARAALALAVLSAVSMSLGLLRWPTLHWQLAAEQAQAAPMVREGIAALFATSNLYLGNVIGEFFGELFLNLFFAFAAFVLARAAARIDRPQHWLLLTGLAASLIGGVAMLRNLTAVVEPIAAANNIVLPLWMLVMGVAMVRQGRAKAVPHIQSLADPVAMPLPEPAKSKRWPRAKSVLVL